MTCRLIVDPGSCHEGDMDKAKALIDAAKDAGAWAIKFQLFPDQPKFTSTGNIALRDPAMVDGVLAYARDVTEIPLFFSVFGDDATMGAYIDNLHCLGVRYMKFAFGNRRRIDHICQALKFYDEVIVSTSPMDHHLLPIHPNLRTLWCPSVHGESIYPVESMLDFSCMVGFDGFSSHCMGTGQPARAINYGAQILEVHMRLEDTPESIPDARIALLPAEVGELARHIKASGGRINDNRGATGALPEPTGSDAGSAARP